MPEHKTFTATRTGYVFAEIISHTGAVNVTVDPSIKQAEFTISTPDSEGPAADAVRGATFREMGKAGQEQAILEIPKTGGINFGGVYNTGRMSNVQNVVSGNSGSTVQINGMTFSGTIDSGVTMVGNDIYIGGRKVVSDGRVIAQQGTAVSGGTGRIMVEIRLPQHSGLRLSTTSARLRVRGDIQTLDVNTTSGDVQAEGVHTLYAHSVSGDIEAERVETRLDAQTTSGDIEIGAYNGGSLHATSVSGDVTISATPAAHDMASVRTVSGGIRLRGCEHLAVRTNTVSGDVRRR